MLVAHNNLPRTVASEWTDGNKDNNDMFMDVLDDEEVLDDVPDLKSYKSLKEMLLPVAPKIHSWQSLEHRQTLYNDTKAIRKLLFENDASDSDEQ
eukprot:UN13215